MLVNLTQATATVDMKSTYPTVDKSIVKADLSEVTANDYKIGDTVNFKIASVVPDMTGYIAYTFKFKDTMSAGLTFGQITAVKVGATVLTASATVADNTYALTKDGQNLSITFHNFIDYAAQAGEAVTVEYTAVLNKEAVTGMNKNTNTATVEYSNDPANVGDGTPENPGSTDESTPDETDVHTFDFEVFKYAGANTPLANAKFKLYSNPETTNELKLIDMTNGIYRRAIEGDVADTNAVAATITTGATGIVKVTGLAAGTYYLKEIEAPEGYNKLVGPITVVVTPTYAGVNGALSKVEVSYTYNGVTQKVETTTTDNSPQIPVENKTGLALPNTGSRGAILFTVGGVVLFAVLLVSGIYSKKKKTTVSK